MKKSTKAVIAVMAIMLLAALAAVISYADVPSLTPGSENVIFIKDLPEGYEGRGIGKTADDPLIPDQEPEGFDPLAANPKNHLKTSFIQAIDLLKDTGGTIVICGPVFFGIDQSWGNGSTQKDVMTPKFETNTIKFTSVYNGVDYRKTADAAIIIESPAMLNIKGQSIWENLTIITNSSDRCISFNGYDTIVGEGVECKPADEDYSEVPSFFVSLAAGARYEGNQKESTTNHKFETTNLLVQSGTYNIICGGTWGVPSAGDCIGVTSNLTLEGTTKVLGKVVGTNGVQRQFDGNVNITINGGTYECDIFGGNKNSFGNEDATVKITINGGTFVDLYSLIEMETEFKLNAPSAAILDLRGYQGDYENLEAINSVLEEYEADFDSVLWPTVWEGPKEHETTPDTTAPDVPDTSETPDSTSEIADTSETPDETDESAVDTVVSDDSSSDDVTTGPEESNGPDSAKETVKGSKGNQNSDEDDGGVNVWLIIGIVAGVVVVAGAVAAILISKKKKGTGAE